MSDQNFSYTPESAWTFFEHTIQGERYGIGCFENDLRPEGTNRGFAVAMVRPAMNVSGMPWVKVCEASRWFENDDFPDPQPFIDRAFRKFNEWLSDTYGEGAEMDDLEQFIHYFSSGLAQFKVGADGKSFVR